MVHFQCAACGRGEARWISQCAGCLAFMTMKPVLADDRNPTITGAVLASGTAHAGPTRAALALVPDIAPDATPRVRSLAVPISISAIAAEDVLRWESGIEPLDRVLGGGLVRGTSVAISADPGAGKSTLVGQWMAALAQRGHHILYATGEETCAQVKIRTQRIDAEHPLIFVVAETDLDRILEHARALEARVIVVDSLQTAVTERVGFTPGSLSMVKAIAGMLTEHVKSESERGRHLAAVGIGHVTKGGDGAGPMTLRHLVDVVATIDKDPEFEALRTLSCTKNRYGSTSERGSFTMGERGLVPIDKDAEPPPRNRETTYAVLAQALLDELVTRTGAIDQGLRDRVGDLLEIPEGI